MADCSCQEVAWLPLVGVTLGGILAMVFFWLFTQPVFAGSAGVPSLVVQRDTQGRITGVQTV